MPSGLLHAPRVSISTRMSKLLSKFTYKMNSRSVFLAALMLAVTALVSPAQTNVPAAPLSPEQQAFLKRKAAPIGVLFIGDDITAAWNGAGRAVWTSRYAKLDAANFGVNGDRTEQLRSRIANGELDGISPKVVILMIGTNNNNESAPKITANITAIVKQINAKLPQSKLLLLGIFPRGFIATDRLRSKMAAVNAELAKLHDGQKTFYLEIWEQFLAESGWIPKETMPDAMHLTARGYQIWADAMQPTLDALLK